MTWRSAEPVSKGGGDYAAMFWVGRLTSERRKLQRSGASWTNGYATGCGHQLKQWRLARPHIESFWQGVQGRMLR